MSQDENRHPFVSSGLFVDITTITVDPAYVAAAARKAALPETAGQRRSPAILLVSSMLAVGALWGVAARQTYERAPAAERIRLSLAADARERQAASQRLADRAAELRRLNDAARADLQHRTTAERALAEELARLQLVTGGARVTGPGLVVRLDDAESDEAGRVADVDLQAIVNALWSAGAEAVAVNDRRVGSLTSIRAAGEAILVDYEPVTAPYEIRAIGDVDKLEPAFADSPTARRFRTWVDAFGIEFGVTREDELTLPGWTVTRLRHARPPASPTPRPTSPRPGPGAATPGGSPGAGSPGAGSPGASATPSGGAS